MGRLGKVVWKFAAEKSPCRSLIQPLRHSARQRVAPLGSKSAGVPWQPLPCWRFSLASNSAAKGLHDEADVEVTAIPRAEYRQSPNISRVRVGPYDPSSTTSRRHAVFRKSARTSRGRTIQRPARVGAGQPRLIPIHPRREQLEHRRCRSLTDRSGQHQIGEHRNHSRRKLMSDDRGGGPAANDSVDGRNFSERR